MAWKLTPPPHTLWLTVVLHLVVIGKSQRNRAKNCASAWPVTLISQPASQSIEKLLIINICGYEHIQRRQAYHHKHVHRHTYIVRILIKVLSRKVWQINTHSANQQKKRTLKQLTWISMILVLLLLWPYLRLLANKLINSNVIIKL